MEISTVPYFDYKIKNEQISLSNLHKLIYETFSSLKELHDSGYYHNDLGDQDSILLKGNLNNWDGVIIMGDKYKITSQTQVDEDIKMLAYMIWQIIVDDVCVTEDKKGNVITFDHSKFIKLVKNNIKRFGDYSKYLKLLLWIFETEPSIDNIIIKLSQI